MRALRERLVYVLPILLLCAAACGATFAYDKIRRANLETTAQRLGIPPTIDAVADYIEGTITIGMTREEVEGILSGIAPEAEVRHGTLREIPGTGRTGYTDYIVLQFTSLPGYPPYTLSILAHYNSDGRLTHMGDVDGETLEIPE